MDIVLAEGQSKVNLEQDKDALKNFTFKLGAILPTDDILESVTWSTSDGITVDNTSHTDTDALARISGGEVNKWYACKATWTTDGGTVDQIVVRVFITEDVEDDLTDLGSALFPNRFTVVAQLRRDQLLLLAQNHFPGVTLDDDYVWEKLRAAEAQISRTLRVKFKPTTMFPTEPTQEQIDALNGAPWEVDTGYDYDPAMYGGSRWGFIQTHHVPIVSLSGIRFTYPAKGGAAFDIPSDWLQVDEKYGHIRILPVSATAAAMLNPYMMGILSSGRVIPNMVQVSYVAGLTNAARDYPDLLDVVKKMAVLKLISDGFLPQSGSISADGLSQSMSIDMSKYEDSIDVILNGPPGANGGLKAAIHGIRMAVM